MDFLSKLNLVKKLSGNRSKRVDALVDLVGDGFAYARGVPVSRNERGEFLASDDEVTTEQLVTVDDLAAVISRLESVERLVVDLKRHRDGRRE